MSPYNTHAAEGMYILWVSWNINPMIEAIQDFEKALGNGFPAAEYASSKERQCNLLWPPVATHA